MDTNLRSLDLNLLVVFEAIMEQGSLSAAADKLNMTQPAVSNALGRLRIQFKDELFIRSRYGMSPTNKAIELLTPIKESLNLIRETVGKKKSFSPSDCTRKFKLAMNDLSEMTLLPPLLNAIEKEGEHLSVETSTVLNVDNIEHILHGRIDFFFNQSEPTDDRLNFVKLAEDQLVVIVRNGHPRIKDKLTSKQFMSEKHVIMSHRLGKQTFLDSLAKDKLKKRKVLAQVHSFSSLPQLVAKTDALGVVSSRAAQHYSSTLPIKTLQIPFPAKKITYFVTWNKTMESDPAHSWLRNKILKLKTG